MLRDEAFTPHADGRPDGWAFVGDAASWVAICNFQTFFVDKRLLLIKGGSTQVDGYINPPEMAISTGFII